MIEKAKFGRNKENWEKADGQGIAHVNTSIFRMQHDIGIYSTYKLNANVLEKE